jgi:hypothetical protein
LDLPASSPQKAEFAEEKVLMVFVSRDAQLHEKAGVEAG